MHFELGTAALQAALPRDGLAQAADVATIVVAAAVLVLAVVATAVLLRVHRTVRELREGARVGLGPVSERVRRVSDNVEFITGALRTDVERLTGSVEALTARLRQASDLMEERIEEFNALMEVVQSEAEDIFLDTASTVRGVRAGARSITAPTEAGAPESEEEEEEPQPTRDASAG